MKNWIILKNLKSSAWQKQTENSTKKKNLKTERQNPKQIQKTNDQKDKGQTGKIYLQLVLQRGNLPNI